MRVLLANNRYFVSGGPEKYMFAVTDLLERAGHEVIPFSVRGRRNRETPWASYFVEPIAGDNEVYFRDLSMSPLALKRGLQRAFYAPDVRAKASRLIADCRPDVALVQNYLRQLSPSLLVALKEAGVPVVVRLSDFSMVCSEAHMLRDGRVCRRCVTHGLLSSVRYRCVQGSFAVSGVVCASMWFAKWRRFFDLVDCFIAPSAVMRDQMIAGGFDGSRIVVLPTFVDASVFDPRGPRRKRLAFVGRLSPEKGVEVLVDAYERVLRHEKLRDVELLIAGDGDPHYCRRLRTQAHRISSQLRLVGPLDAEGVRRLLSSAQLSVVPSLWYENLPNSLLESLAAGTPVAASDLGSMAEVLRGTDAGFLFRPGDARDLAAGLVRLLLHPDTLRQMSKSARGLAEGRYAPSAHLRGLVTVLESARHSGANCRR